MSTSRRSVLLIAAGVIIGFTSALIMTHQLFPHLLQIISLVVSVVLIVSFAIGTVAAGLWTKTKKGQGWQFHLPSLVVALALAFITYALVSIATGTGLFASVRSQPGWTSLPKGNLIFPSNVTDLSLGWFCFLIVAIMLGAVFFLNNPFRRVKLPGALGKFGRRRAAAPQVIVHDEVPPHVDLSEYTHQR